MPNPDPRYASIAEFAARCSAPVPCAGNLPVALDDPQCIWFIERGSVDVFLVEFKDGVEQVSPRHMLRKEAGSLLPSVRPDAQGEGSDTTLSMIAKGLPGTLLRRLPLSRISELQPAELAAQVDTWLNAIMQALSRFASSLPRPITWAEPGVERTLGPCSLSTRSEVVWVSLPAGGASLFMDILDQAEFADVSGVSGAGTSGESDAARTLMPLTQESWLTVLDETPVSFHSTEMLAQQGILLQALAPFYAVAFKLERLNRRLALVDAANLARERAASRIMAEHTARERLFNIYDLPVDGDADIEDKALADVLHIIGRHQGIDFRIPNPSALASAPIRLADILDVSGIRARRVRLRTEDNWWRGDSNALLAFRAGDGRPVALLPGLFGRYRKIDPASGRSERVTAQRAEALRQEAWMFYRPLPQGSVSAMDILKIAFRGSAGDLVRLVLAGLPGGLIKLLPAIALGFVVNHAASSADSGWLYALVAAVAGFGLLGALLHVLQGAAMMRLEGRSATRVEAAFWDRLMRLPRSILHRHTTGDLAMSGMLFQNLRDGMQDIAADSLLSLLFLLPVFGVIFFYDATLGSIALAFSVVSLLTAVALGLRQIAPHGQMIRAARHVVGRLFQILGGIAKLRVENAEGSAFAIWARDYRQQKRAELEQGALEEHSRAFAAALPFLAGGAMLFAVAATGDRSTPVGDFLVVYLVFIAFQSAIARLGESFGAVAAMLPTLAQMRPLLAAVPEAHIEGEPVDYLGGDVLFDHVSFRYDPDGPLILDDVTIRARPGEFVAIAGESGAGKSTLFQLALGFDAPAAGAVYYDGRDLANLNLKQVRRKIGAVPQSVQLHPQDIWDNIVAHHDETTAEEVWQAARSARIEDEIKAMPMGMMTMVGASETVLSGGEGQRVTIARALIGNPRVLLLDEATNWLDNENQAQVMRNLAHLTSTRIVIAHRLSTLEQADRIYVMQAGKVVQVGFFDELMAVDGVFRDLVRRQLA